MPMVSVFGSNGELAPGVSELSEGLGKLILDLGCRVCTGGRGGVMEAVSRGARTSENWTGREIMGILPEEDDRAANPFLDIVIPIIITNKTVNFCEFPSEKTHHIQKVNTLI